MFLPADISQISTPTSSNLKLFNTGRDEFERSKLVALMHEIGGSVSNLSPEQIVLIARAGSHLYDLAKADSDADYVIIYADPLQVIFNCILS